MKISNDGNLIRTTEEGSASTAALDNIRRYCLFHQLRVAAAESVSAGLLQSLLSSAEEAGLFFEGGITLYNCKQKHRHLGIPPEICSPSNGVTAEISRQMAFKVCELFDCRLGLSLTGYASPLPEQNIEDLFAFGSVALDGEIIYCGKIIGKNQEPDELKEEYARVLVVECAKALLSKMEGKEAET